MGLLDLRAKDWGNESLKNNVIGILPRLAEFVRAANGPSEQGHPPETAKE